MITKSILAPPNSFRSCIVARMITDALAISVIATFATKALAQQVSNSLATESAAGRIVTTPARAAQALDTAIPNTTVITREAIAQAGNISLSELLRRYARMENTALGPYASAQGASARGGSGARVLYILDGVPLSDSGASAFAGQFLSGARDLANASIGQIPLALLERIEVSVGPLSALYGGEGAEAVVAMFTRADLAHKPGVAANQQRPASLQVDGQFGSESYRGITANITSHGTDFTIAGTAGINRLDAGSTTNDSSARFNSDRDPQRQSFGALKMSHRMFHGEQVSLNLIGVKGKQKVDSRSATLDFSGTANVFDEKVDHTLQIAKITSITYFAPYWRSRIEVSRQFDKAEYAGQVAQRIRSTRDVAAWTNELGIVGGKLIIGGEIKRNKVDTGGEAQLQLTKRSETQAGVFVGLRERYGAHLLELNARHDRALIDSEKNQTPVSGAYALALPIAEFYLNAGRGYREPTMYERYSPTTIVGNTLVSTSNNSSVNVPITLAGNPNLKIERTQSREIGIRKSGIIGGNASQNYRVNLAAFDNQVRDRITIVNNGADRNGVSISPGNVASNLTGKERSRGLELSGDVEWEGYRLATSLISQNAKYGDGTRVSGKAKQYGYLALSKQVGDFSLSSSVSWTGNRASNLPLEEKMGGFAVINAGVSYRWDREWTVDLVANNITDKRYELVRGFNQPGASLMFNVRFSAQEK